MMNWGVLAEMGFMLSIPIAIKKNGSHKVLIFEFFYEGGQIYIDKKTQEELKSQAQGFIFLVTFCLGLLVGTLIDGRVINFYTQTIAISRDYDWDASWGITSVLSIALLVVFLGFLKRIPENHLKIKTSWTTYI